MPHGNRISIDLANGSRCVLVHNDSIKFIPVEEGSHDRESAWMVPNTVANADLLSVDPPYPEELNYDPMNPDPISTIPGEPNYSPTYPDPK